MRFASLGSGSEGNALLIECADGDRRVRLLIDCGFGAKEAARRFEALGVDPATLDAVLVTHEHGDHVGGAFRLGATLEVPVHATRGTVWASGNFVAAATRAGRTLDLRPVDPDTCFEIGGVRVLPVSVPHDAREPVQYLIDDGVRRLAVLTDLGHASAHVLRALSGLDALVLECNHDPALLEASDYPASLKRRVAGPWGHLSNGAAAELLAALDQTRLRTVAAAHLSRQNNRPELACEALARAWGVTPDAIRVADQDQGLDWIAVA